MMSLLIQLYPIYRVSDLYKMGEPFFQLKSTQNTNLRLHM